MLIRHFLNRFSEVLWAKILCCICICCHIQIFMFARDKIWWNCHYDACENEQFFIIPCVHFSIPKPNLKSCIYGHPFVSITLLNWALILRFESPSDFGPSLCHTVLAVGTIYCELTVLAYTTAAEKESVSFSKTALVVKVFILWLIILINHIIILNKICAIW